MADKCGDDLRAARRFMDLCHAHMSEIFSGGQLPMLDVVNRLGEIQSHAKLMHARSIYRSAQEIIDDLTRRRSVQACAGSVLVLQKLIRQYNAGLSEIAPVALQVIRKPKANPAGPAIVSEMAQQKTAAMTLAPLVKFADEAERSSLITLVKLAANQTSSPISNTSAESAEKIDVVLPSLTNHWLRLARTQDKSISVSSALCDGRVRADRLKVLQKGLKGLGELLITQSVEKPEARAARSLSRSAHLAITGSQTGKQLDILVSCEGLAPEQEDIEIISSMLAEIDMKTAVEIDDDLIRVKLSGLACETDRAGNFIKEAAS